MKKVKYPIRHSITIAITVFVVFITVMLTAINYYNFYTAFFDDYRSYIDEILSLSVSCIDSEALKESAKTLEESDEYLRMRKFMDNLMDCMDIHALYVIKPVVIDGKNCLLSVISAEAYQDRYVDTEGNLWLGYIIDDTEYDQATIDRLFDIMQSGKTEYFVDSSAWGTDYTGAMPLLDKDGNPYALLCVDIEMSDILYIIRSNAIKNALTLIIAGTLFTILFKTMTNKYVSRPITRLQESVTSYAEKCSGVREAKDLEYDDPKINSKNEIEALSDAVLIMTESIEEYVNNVASAEKRAENMEDLANKDALTNVRNKTAYNEFTKRMELDISNEEVEFGIVMIDLNFLKKINDTHGHEHGDEAIKKLCGIVCEIFEHSPVFRIGGDEFVVILKGRDHEIKDELIRKFEDTIKEYGNDESLEPWDRISAAIGYAEYDRNTDHDMMSVFRRADQAMYANKKAMKAARED